MPNLTKWLFVFEEVLKHVHRYSSWIMQYIMTWVNLYDVSLDVCVTQVCLGILYLSLTKEKELNYAPRRI